jgi:hypothetical protein
LFCITNWSTTKAMRPSLENALKPLKGQVVILCHGVMLT